MNVHIPSPAAANIPIIDLSGSYSPDLADRKAIAGKIHEACQEPGFFYVVNHSVPVSALNLQLQLARDFFALSSMEKLKVDARSSPCMRGYQPAGIQALDAKSLPDLKEGFLTGCDLDEDHPYVRQGVPNTGANQWPQNPVNFRQDFEAYVGYVVELGAHLMRCMALSLDLPEDYFDAGLAEPTVNSQIYHYPPGSAESVSAQLGAGAHTDWGMLTILLQDDVGGLEVQNSDGNWIEAPSVPNSLVINLGEMMPILTNGLYQARSHRVVNRAGGKDRYSAPTFFDPDYYYRVECVPTCRPTSEEHVKSNTTVGEHIANMYRKAYGQAA